MMKKIFIILLITLSNVIVNAKSLINSPTNFRVDETVTEYDMYIFRWNAVPLSHGYKVYYRRNIANATWNYASVSASATSVRLFDYMLKFPMNYVLYVVAIDASGAQSAPSNSIVYGCTSLNLPSKVINIKSNTITDTSFNLTWDSSMSGQSPLQGYSILNSDGSPLKYSVTNFVTLSGLSAGTVYKLKIRAINTFGCYTDSDLFTVSTYCSPPLGSDSKASPGSYISKVSLGSINSSTIYNGQFYANKRAINTALTKGLSNSVRVTVIATDENLNAGVAAYIDFNNNGVYNENGEIITFGALSTKQKSINAPVTFVSNNFTVPSTVVNGFTTLRVVYQRDPSTLSLNPCSFPNSAKGEIEDYGIYLSDGTSRIITPESISELPVEIATAETSAKKIVHQEDQGITIYPNPFSGNELTVTNVESNTPYTIMDTSGRIVENKTISNNHIDVSSLSKGVYVLYLKSKGKELFKKIIKKIKKILNLLN